MPTVLVVDDSAVDRRLVAEYLKVDQDLHLEYAVHGAEALEKMESQLPDLVVTDLIMPEVDGLELVAAVRNRYPLVPVILMTSKGSEEIVVRALQSGAASYVPKHTFARRLLSTVQNVLAVSRRQRRHSRLMECLTKTRCVFQLENKAALVHPMVTYLQERATHLGVCDESDATRIGVALEEALANALYHGNLEVGSELRGEDDQAYHSLIAQRCQTPPYCHRRVHVRAELSRDEALFAIRDEGNGFDPASLPDPTDPANLEKASGRGLLLMRAFMDDVGYNDAGNEVTLIKRRAAPPPTSDA
jgi:CheY-like chemotaxis protein/anti-sigma regulatory factor (Ser/Thr protein kinase)